MNTIKKSSNIKVWSPSSWRSLKISQQPVYKDKPKLEAVLKKITSLPGIVNYNEIVDLKSKLAKCHENNSFIIQVGDCAERFDDANEETIQKKINFFNFLNHILAFHLKKEVITIGRIAGQYAKPRSNDYEVVNNNKLEVFRGEIINEITPNAEKRDANPERMLEAYKNSIITINQIKDWNTYGEKSKEFYKKIYKEEKVNPQTDKYVDTLLNFYDNFPSHVNIERNKIYTSHEGLLLNYEECFIRKIGDKYYDLSAHFLWIGERTRNLEEAHVEFFRGISNPIGIKTGPRTNLDELIEVIKIINPLNELGKVVIITRFGTENCEAAMDSLCEIIKKSNLNIIFMCDPNHGNTKVHNNSNKKVRYFDEMKDEILNTNKILNKHGLFLSGIHLESSCNMVTECIGGINNEVTEIIEESYTTYCDPRLNKLQTIEICDYTGNSFSQGNCEENIVEKII